MPPSASTAAWRTPAEAGRAGRVLKIAGVVLAATAAAQYLAGVIFLWLLHLDVHGATPLTVLRYGYYYGDVPQVREALLRACAGGTLLVLMSAALLVLPRRRPLHGEARFATRREIAAAGLLGDQGIILGRIGRRCLMLRGQQGVVLAAPPRAGKGVGVVIPNLLNWPDSAICIDIKRENWTLTAGFRAQSGQACFLFDPFAEDGR
ncbi:MAG: type IV secretory system conjugative DNA transfer family protein, partial [Steroidobacteraceae bacterium]